MAGSRLIVRRDVTKFFFDKLSIYNRYEVVVGIPSDARNKSGESLVAIGTAHEFGSPKNHIPERSFLRATFDLNQRKYASILERGIKDTIKRGTDPRRTLFRAGQTARGDVIKRINEGIPPALSPNTIVAKGSSLPLVDTGALRSSITARVRKDGIDVA